MIPTDLSSVVPYSVTVCGRESKIYLIHSNTGICNAMKVRSSQGKLSLSHRNENHRN